MLKDTINSMVANFLIWVIFYIVHCNERLVHTSNSDFLKCDLHLCLLREWCTEAPYSEDVLKAQLRVNMQIFSFLPPQKHYANFVLGW